MVQQLASIGQWDVIDLYDYNIIYYDYEHMNSDDDYLPLIKRIISDYDTLIFATPVYWYAMSGLMKVFFDRFTDLLKTEKDWGRKLRGKNFAAMSCSEGGGNLEEMFWIPFKESADYLGMNYKGHMHIIVNETTTDELTIFAHSITQ